VSAIVAAYFVWFCKGSIECKYLSIVREVIATKKAVVLSLFDGDVDGSCVNCGYRCVADADGPVSG